MGQSLFNVGRMLTSTEWGELKAWRAANPELRWKRGDVRDGGQVFMYYGATQKSGERWVDPVVLVRTRGVQNRKRQENIEESRAACRRYYADRAEDIKKRRRDKYAADSEATREASRKWKQANPDRVLAGQRAWVASNRQKIRDWKTTKYQTDPVFRIATLCRTRVRAAVRNAGFTKRSNTHSLIGCDWGELKRHLETLFVPGMSWDNAGAWHVDHIIPLSSASTQEEVQALCHYTNLQPLWARDNLRKSDKMPHELLA